MATRRNRPRRRTAQAPRGSNGPFRSLSRLTTRDDGAGGVRGPKKAVHRAIMTGLVLLRRCARWPCSARIGEQEALLTRSKSEALRAQDFESGRVTPSWMFDRHGATRAISTKPADEVAAAACEARTYRDRPRAPERPRGSRPPDARRVAGSLVPSDAPDGRGDRRAARAKPKHRQDPCSRISTTSSARPADGGRRSRMGARAAGRASGHRALGAVIALRPRAAKATNRKEREVVMAVGPVQLLVIGFRASGLSR